MLALRKKREKKPFLLQEDICPNESRKERKIKYLCFDGNNLLERVHPSVGGGRPLENTAWMALQGPGKGRPITGALGTLGSSLGKG